MKVDELGRVQSEMAAAPSDAAGFADAVQPHLPSMYRLAARVAPSAGPDDIVQEALVRAWRNRARYDPKRAPFSAWLMAIVANEAKRATSRRTFPIRLPPSTQPISADQRIDIEDAVRRLPPRQRLAVDYYYFAGLSLSETAFVMRCAEGTVKSTLADARSRLRLELQETDT